MPTKKPAAITRALARANAKLPDTRNFAIGPGWGVGVLALGALVILTNHVHAGTLSEKVLELQSAWYHAVLHLVQFLGWALFSWGLIHVFTDQIFDSIKKAQDLMPALAHSAVMVAPVVLAGSVVAGTVASEKNEDAVAQRVSGAELASLKSSLTRIQQQADQLTLDVGKVRESTALIEPNLRTLSDQTEKAKELIVEKSGSVQAAVDSTRATLERDVKNGFASNERSLISEFRDVNTVLSRLSTVNLQRDEVLEKSTATERATLEARLQKSLDSQLKATNEIAARQLIARWSSLTGGDPMRFGEDRLVQRDDIRAADLTLDAYENYRKSRSLWAKMLSPLTDPGQKEICMRETFPKVKTNCDLP
jgi:hypothetical protein